MGTADSDSSGPFIGSWTLISYELLSSGVVLRPFGDHPVGRILYQKNGQMSAQLMGPAPAAFEKASPLEASAEEANAAWRNYYGYWGTFTIDQKARIVIHHIEGSWFPNWMGEKQIRSFRLSGNKLILEADGPAGHATLTWQKID